MIEVVKVKIRDAGQIVYYNPRGLKFLIDDLVILEADRGVDYGVVVSEVELLDNAKINESLKSVIRKADGNDIKKIADNKNKALEAIKSCQGKITSHGLDMKVVQAEYSFDLSKLIFYFTADGRIDFRDLVKELAAVFKVRIELRQIGVRDEAKMFGGIGHCGRKLCCATFLHDFEPVTIKMAKEQNLSLNPTKISGVCGRLMCCLGYENETYRCMGKDVPRPGDVVKLKNGDEGRVIDVNILKKKVLIVVKGTTTWVDLSGCTCPDKKCEIHSQYTFRARKKSDKKKQDKQQKDDKPSDHKQDKGKMRKHAHKQQADKANRDNTDTDEHDTTRGDNGESQ